MTDLLTDLIEISETNFRLQGQKYLLTYKSHLPKDEYEAFIEGWKGFKKLYIAHENGLDDPVTPYEHTHVVVDFGKSVQSRNCRILDFKGIHPHISKITKPKEWKKACLYITKEDKSVVLDDGDEFSENPIQKIWEKTTVYEALESMDSLSDALATIAVYEHKPPQLPESDLSDDCLYKWQKDLKEMIDVYPFDRKVYWIYDTIGNCGKTAFAKHMCLEYPQKCTMFNNVGRVTDFANNMRNKVDAGWRGNTIFINISRSYSDRDQIYEVIEMIKDGFITLTKYKGGELWLGNMHVVVLCNFEPHWEKLSPDRWECYTVDPRDYELFGLVPVERPVASVTLSKGRPYPKFKIPDRTDF